MVDARILSGCCRSVGVRKRILRPKRQAGHRNRPLPGQRACTATSLPRPPAGPPPGWASDAPTARPVPIPGRRTVMIRRGKRQVTGDRSFSELALTVLRGHRRRTPVRSRRPALRAPRKPAASHPHSHPAGRAPAQRRSCGARARPFRGGRGRSCRDVPGRYRDSRVSRTNFCPFHARTSWVDRRLHGFGPSCAFGSDGCAATEPTRGTAHS